MEQLAAITEEIIKAITVGDGSEGISLLEKASKMDVTESWLRTTGLNVVLNDLRKNPNKNLAAAAKATVHAYKAALGIESKKRKAEEDLARDSKAARTEGTTDVASSKLLSPANDSSSTPFPASSPTTPSSSIPASSLSVSVSGGSINGTSSGTSSSSSSASTPTSSAADGNQEGKSVPAGSPTEQAAFGESTNAAARLGGTGDNERDKVQSLLFEALGTEASAALRTVVAVAVEAAIYEEHVGLLV